ncbi:MAG: patatin-like phospholipase family protein [Xanthomonadales bacterium]|nr:patatin-like phospholipase family protein [Xanthomonadales bacterium]
MSLRTDRVAPIGVKRVWRLAAAAALMLASGAANAEQCRQPEVALALGSGGAAGLSHIAMLRVFEELDVEPAAIAGTSIGAIIGALYAAGLDADAIESVFREFGGSALDPFSRLLDDDGAPGLTDLVEIDLDRGSVLDSGRFIEFLAERIEARSFADLEIPLRIVATDFWTGEARVLEEGDLLEAVQASMAVPGLFAPVEDGERLLIDGGASNPLPVDLLEGYDIVVAIDVTGSRRPEVDGRPGVTDLLFSSFEIMQQSILRARSSREDADIYIKPELTDIRMLHFDRVGKVLEQSETAARELAGKLREKLESISCGAVAP